MVSEKPMSAKVAIVGRPNVGKSTLFNRLVGRKLALVDDEPGVTRDRREGEARLGDLLFTVVDTAGLEQGDGASLAGRMRAQTEAALADCDAILFLIDARAGVTGADRHFAQGVRRAGKPVILIANKAEGLAGRQGAYEAFGLGLGDPIAFSAEHGEGLGELHEALDGVLPATARIDADEEDEPAPLTLGDEEDGSEADPLKPLRIAVLGRPNAGKSTLLNRILGEERLLTGPEPGLTRDSIGLEASWRDRRFKLFDTAGLRRRSRVVEKLEQLAVADALRAVRFAEVVVLLLDATIPFEKQDLTLADLVEREGRALVIGLNKWDLIADKSVKAQELRAEADRLLPQLRGTRRHSGLGLDRRACRQVAGGGGRCARSLEPARLDRAAQPLAGAGRRRDAAARGRRPPGQNPLHDPAQGAPALLRAVRQSRRQHPGELQALSRQRPARDFRALRRADKIVDARGKRESLCAERQTELVSAGPPERL